MFIYVTINLYWVIIYLFKYQFKIVSLKVNYFREINHQNIVLIKNFTS